MNKQYTVTKYAAKELLKCAKKWNDTLLCRKEWMDCENNP